MIVRAKTSADRAALASILVEHFAGETAVSRGRQYRPLDLEGFVAEEEDGRTLGMLTHAVENGELEIVTLNSLAENKGAGSALLAAAVEEARALGLKRAWLVTTNDNIRALRFYQRRGWDMVALHRDALEASRELKPQIPLVGDDGIAIRHEIEFEFRL